MNAVVNACVLCGGTRAIGLLCVACAARLTSSSPLLPHQIDGRGVGQDAHVIDAWGRPHALDDRSVLGREGATLRLATGVVSRAHAAIERVAGGWQARDIGSHNGSSLNRVALGAEPRALASGDLLHLADVGFAFVLGAAPAIEAPAARTQTLAANARDALAFALHENPMGGGGVLELSDGRTWELPLLQLELLQLLTAEWQRGEDAAPEVRGFVTSAYLMSVLSWDSHEPGPDHLKQLIRRTRQQLAGSGVGIESRRGAGYRLGREARESAGDA